MPTTNPDPSRRGTTTEDGEAAANVSLLWLQRRLNAHLTGRTPAIREDGIFGPETARASSTFLFEVLGVDRESHMLRGSWYDAEVSPTDPSRIVMTTPLELALSAGGPGVPSTMPSVTETPPSPAELAARLPVSAGLSLPVKVGIGLTILAGGLWGFSAWSKPSARRRRR